MVANFVAFSKTLCSLVTCRRCSRNTEPLLGRLLRSICYSTNHGSLAKLDLAVSSPSNDSGFQETQHDSHISSTSDGLLYEHVRFNMAKIQMIPENLRQMLFCEPAKVPDANEVEECIKHLKSKGLWGFKPQILPIPHFDLPELSGNNIAEHFYNIGREQTRVYVQILEELLQTTAPPYPKEWLYKSGWTKYSRDGSTASVLFPDDDALVFDVETCLSSGKYPTLAAALSKDGWYSWCSSALIDDLPEPLTEEGRLRLKFLIPLEAPRFSSDTNISELSFKKRLVVGHNVAFDRSFIQEQYLLHGSQMKFLDTLSLHVSLAGFTNEQRALHMKLSALKRRNISGEKEPKTRVAPKAANYPNSDATRRWLEIGSMNNLEDVYCLHCKSVLPYDKSLSKVFVEGTMDDVRKNFQSLMGYCASDVHATHRLAATIFPKFKEASPHPVSLSGILEMSSAYLPVNKNWEIYISKANSACNNIEDDMKKNLMELAKEALVLQKGQAYKEDLWLWDQDWSMQKVTSRTKNSQLLEYPKWFRVLCKAGTIDQNGILLPDALSLRMKITPKLMRMTWNGFPLHHSLKHGWGWLEPLSDASDQPAENFLEPVQKTQDPKFPLHVLVKLAKSLNQPFGIVPKQNGRLSSEVTSNKDTSQQLSDSDWEKLSEMTPEEQQAFFTKNIGVEGLVFPTEVQTRIPISLDADSELVREISEDIEQRESSFKSKSTLTKKLDKPDTNAIVDVVPGCIFHRLIHANGPECNVGSPLSRDFLQYFESRILKASFGNASEVIKSSKMVTYWHNNKDRVESQLVGALEPNSTSPEVKDHRDYDPSDRLGVILPRLIYMGTVTRRAVEATWMTASNAKPDRIGSELKAMVQSPPGYSLVGADVDSQELWIAALLGDANWLKQHGCTAFGWMTLQGNKVDGTDLHSKTAEQAGVERDHAKILNYGRIYGAGRDYAALLMRNFNKNLTDAQAAGKAQKIYTFSKGYRTYELNSLGQHFAQMCGLTDEELERPFRGFEIKELYESAVGQQIGKSRGDFNRVLSEITSSTKWSTGSESHMFNMMEAIATSMEPRTPVLGSRISRCLLKENVADDFMTSRCNWVVQSSAVDYLHLMLVSMKWIMEKFNIRGRFCLSIHDEVRYIIHDEDRYRAVLALHITNLLTRAMFAYQLGIRDLPQSVAFFSAVDVDKVLRKETNLDCITPSNSGGLEKEYGVKKGQALDIYKTLEKTGGSLKKLSDVVASYGL